MRRRSPALLPVLLGACWLSVIFAPLLVPGRALSNRDIAVFHLPLRATFGDLASFGLPLWNPWLHGGQPLLSNPSYGAFYPPSWLVLAVSPPAALTLLVLLHGAIAFAGAWRLARHFGCSRGVAALAAVGYSGSGPYLSMLSAFTLYCSLAWLPWLLLWGDRTLRPLNGEPWWRPALLAGGVMGLQLLNGEPSTVVMSGLALLALSLGRGTWRPAVILRLAVPVSFALALSAVQIFPALDHLADSPRKDLAASHATIWSMPAVRLVELFIPRFFGDPAHSLDGQYIGGKLEDRSYPYVVTLYPGLLLAVLGASALLRWRIPRRASWGLALIVGYGLALGRHNPVYPLLREIPLLSVLRFPEKFIILGVAALSIAGVLGWHWLLAQREEGKAEAADFPLILVLVVLAIVLALLTFLYVAPVAALGVISASLDANLAGAAESVLQFLREQAWVAAAFTAAVGVLLAFCRWPRTSRRLLEAAAVLLLATDLWYFGREIPETVPVSSYRNPPPLAAALLPTQGRIYVQTAEVKGGMALRRVGDQANLVTRTTLARLEPYSGLLWHLPYAFNVDFDFTLTSWARRAEETLWQESVTRERFFRYLGVWSVEALVLHARPEDPPPVNDPLAAGLQIARNPYRMSRFRFVPAATFQSSQAAALAAARAAGWRVARHEQLVRPGGPVESVALPHRPRVLQLADEGGRVRLDYQADGEAIWVAGTTFDPGWQAEVDGRPVAVYPTAACQIGLLLPPGRHRLTLRYRERLLAAGAAVTLAALAGGAAGLLFARRRPRLA